MQTGEALPRASRQMATVSPEPKLGGLPTTIEQALQPSREARIITEPNEPFRILHVNEVWCQACGFDAEEALGQTCRILQGLGTCRATLAMLRQALLLKRNFAVQLLNYTKRGRPFMSTLQVAPLFNSEAQVTHYLGVVIARFLDGGGTVPPSIQITAQPAPLPNQQGRSCLDHNESMSIKSDENSGGDGSDHNSSSAQSNSSGRVPPFLTKLSEILTTEPPEVISFCPGTASFSVVDPSKFAKEVHSTLPALPRPPPPLPLCHLSTAPLPLPSFVHAPPHLSLPPFPRPLTPLSTATTAIPLHPNFFTGASPLLQA